FSRRIVYKNGPPSSLMRASCTDYYELITDNFITSGISTYCVIIVQPLAAKQTERARDARGQRPLMENLSWIGQSAGCGWDD
ncbi:hypothetical protein, partial [Dialister sp.]|uniref:hypothetical protein n=1 Tax=Dialister sp. TaxID=1955814 RepID=UPI002E8232FF